MVTRGEFMRSVAKFTNAMMVVVAAMFIIAAGTLIGGFALALPILDVIPQARALIISGWAPAPAWALSISTSALPLVYSFSRSGYRINTRRISIMAVVYHVFFWGLRLFDAFLDAVSIGVFAGATQTPDPGYLVNASVYQLIVVFMVFILSNVTDEMKTIVVTATREYSDWVIAIVRKSGGK